MVQAESRLPSPPASFCVINNYTKALEMDKQNNKLG